MAGASATLTLPSHFSGRLAAKSEGLPTDTIKKAQRLLMEKLGLATPDANLRAPESTSRKCYVKYFQEPLAQDQVAALAALFAIKLPVEMVQINRGRHLEIASSCRWGGLVNVVVWNVRGLNNPARWSVVRDAAASVVALVESKLNTVTQSSINQILGSAYDGFVALPAVGAAGVLF